MPTTGDYGYPFAGRSRRVLGRVVTVHGERVVVQKRKSHRSR